MENTFGILSARWRLLLKPIEASEKNLDNIIESMCCLHNYLISRSDTGGLPGEGERGDDLQLQQAQNIVNPHANHAAQAARQMQSNLMAFLNLAGAVEWQWEML